MLEQQAECILFARWIICSLYFSLQSNGALKMTQVSYEAR